MGGWDGDVVFVLGAHLVSRRVDFGGVRLRAEGV